ncbi:MAG: hypothetical protein RL033_518 [Pseudomonadota bacterium]|jgi:hypothetical protein
MYELRVIAFGCALSLLSCAGGAGESRSESERASRVGAERQRLSTERGGRDAVSGAGRGDVVSPGGSEPGTLGSNTNWRPLDPLQRRNPLPLSPALDDPEEVLDPEDPDQDSAAPEADSRLPWAAITPESAPESDPESDPEPAASSSTSSGSSSGDVAR